MPSSPSRLFKLPPRWRPGALLAAAVVALHAALLGGLPNVPAPAPDAPRRVALSVQVRALAPASTLAAVPAPPPARARSTPNRAVPPANAAVSPAANPAANPVATPAGDAEPATAAAAAPDVAGAASDVPVYATQAPSAATLHFELRRGAQSGQAVLAWRPGESTYELSLDSSTFGLPALGSASRGAFDAAGMAPERYVDKRRGRELRAANFQRQAHQISFSGPAQTLPLWPGSQDRLSWMLQLPAVLRANPNLATPGAQLQMWVVGARGLADVWVFSVIGLEDLQLPEGPVPAALHLQREPRRPYDTQVDIWLDPARQHLPVRARLGLRPTGESTELLLQRLE